MADAKVSELPVCDGAVAAREEAARCEMMIDTETLGTGTSAALLQIGVAVFGGGQILAAQEWTLNLDEVLKRGGRVNADTFRWWMEQKNDAARTSVAKGGTSIGKALGELRAMWSAHRCRRVWSHGAGFDVRLLDGYFERLGQRSPWDFHDVRDTRTLFELAETLTGWRRARGTTAHTAAADAVAQTRDVMAAQRALAERMGQAAFEVIAARGSSST